MAVTRWLADTSALVRIEDSPDAAEWSSRAERGLVAVCTTTRLELGYTARSAAEHHAALTAPPLSQMPTEYLRPRAEDRAIEVQAMLAARGQHRAPSVPDLLLAALAEISGLTVLHIDMDFDLIAEITGQPVERLVTHRA